MSAATMTLTPKPVRTARELAEDRTAPSMPPPTKPLDVSAEGLQRLYAERERLKSAAAEEIARVGEAAARIIAVRQPFNELVQSKTNLLAVIARAEAYRAVPLAWLAEYREWIAKCFANENGIADGLLFVSRERQHWLHARDLLVELDFWLAERKSELPILEAKVQAYAVQHGLAHNLDHS